MTDGDRILATADSVLLVDWPSREVPEALVRAGYQVFVKAGPDPGDYSIYELRGADVVAMPAGHPPEHADLVYVHRPVGELPKIVAIAQQVGATSVWHQSGLSGTGAKDPRGCWMPEAVSQQARAIVESAGLIYLQEPYIADVIRRLATRKE